MTGARLPVPNPQVLFTEIDDGSGVLLHLETKFYFTLNATGVVVWKALAERAEGADVAAIAKRLASEFRVAPEAASRDVTKVIETLLADGLVTSR
jgi:hypothetical protein